MKRASLISVHHCKQHRKTKRGKALEVIEDVFEAITEPEPIRKLSLLQRLWRWILGILKVGRRVQVLTFLTSSI